MTPLAFYGRVSTEDQQDPEASRGWQLSRARQLLEPVGGRIVAEYFDLGTSRSLPWKRRPEAARLLDALSDPNRGFGGVVIGEPQRAFYGNQFSLTFPIFTYYGVQLWVPEVGGPIDPGSEAHDLVMTLFGGMSKGERNRIQVRTRAAMRDLAARTDRFLGGRPPYGYRLVDAGRHPNPGRAAAGQRAHRLAPDDVAAPVVRRISKCMPAEQAFGPSPNASRRTGSRHPAPTTRRAILTVIRAAGRSPRCARSSPTSRTRDGGCGPSSARSKSSLTQRTWRPAIELGCGGALKMSGSGQTSGPTRPLSMTNCSLQREDV